MRDRLVLSDFDTPPLRIGARFVLRQRLAPLLGRWPVIFKMAAGGSAVCTGGTSPTDATRAKAQMHADRRFCPERFAS